MLLIANLLALGVALAASGDWQAALELFVRSAAILEPVLIATLLVLYLTAPQLARLAFWPGAVAVMALVLVLSMLAHAALASIAGASLPRTLALAAGCCAVLLGYLWLHTRAFSPALAEARLQALQARIRPHFLFNSLNAVLALIRRDPRRAEHALEDLAELFRALMSDGRSLVRLADEIALLERYAAIEQLRLGERLRLAWDLDDAPMDALLPPLLLQPLLENAVYHGVEPGTGVSDVLVRIGRKGDRILARIENPHVEGEHASRSGNRMALDNIRERLMLYFDAEARLESRVEAGRYRVEIEIPYRAGPA